MARNTKAAAILEMINKGMSNKEIRTRMKVSPGYLWKLRNQMPHKAEESEDVKEALYQVTRGRQARQTAAQHNAKIKNMIENWKNEPEIDDVLDERHKSYGSFRDLAALSQKFKSVAHTHANQFGRSYAPDQAEALDMIFTKIARIINGDAGNVDSWTDIAGYAKLVADRLQGTVR